MHAVRHKRDLYNMGAAHASAILTLKSAQELCCWFELHCSQMLVTSSISKRPLCSGQSATHCYGNLLTCTPSVLLQSRLCDTWMKGVRSVRFPDDTCTSHATAPQPVVLLPEVQAPRYKAVAVPYGTYTAPCLGRIVSSGRGLPGGRSFFVWSHGVPAFNGGRLSKVHASHDSWLVLTGWLPHGAVHLVTMRPLPLVGLCQNAHTRPAAVATRVRIARGLTRAEGFATVAVFTEVRCNAVRAGRVNDHYAGDTGR